MDSFFIYFFSETGISSKTRHRALALSHRGCSLLEEEGSLSQRQSLTDEVSALGEEEQRLEQLIQTCSKDMRCMSELSSNQKYPFVPTRQR